MLLSENIDSFVMTVPDFIDTSVQNNIWMRERKDCPIDKQLFLDQWYDLYNTMASSALIYLMPSVKGLQDQTYVNSFVILNGSNRIAVISKFRAAGRDGESIVAENFLRSLHFDVHQCPYFFEGYAELKYVKDNTYIGGYGLRTSEEALDWMSERFGIKIIKIKISNAYLYHLDCNLFIIDKDNIILATDDVDRHTLKELEQVVNIHSIDNSDAKNGMASCIRLGDKILHSAVNVDYMEVVCSILGLTPCPIDVSESIKSGAMLACFVTPLNYDM